MSSASSKQIIRLGYDCSLPEFMFEIVEAERGRETKTIHFRDNVKVLHMAQTDNARVRYYLLGPIERESATFKYVYVTVLMLSSEFKHHKAINATLVKSATSIIPLDLVNGGEFHIHQDALSNLELVDL